MGARVGLFWFKSKLDYDGIRRLAGVEDMPSTYEEWLALAESAEKGLSLKGHVPVRAVADKDTFLSFCGERGLNVDSKARVRFANEFVANSARGK